MGEVGTTRNRGEGGGDLRDFFTPSGGLRGIFIVRACLPVGRDAEPFMKDCIRKKY